MNNEDLQLLHNSQMQTFELARQNFAGLQQVVYKEIPFGTFSIHLQYNPARILSTNAKIDRQTLQNRPCFLCQHHLPAGQQGIAYGNQYHIFVNPYPIFNRHFTVPAKIHTPQQIGPHFENLLNLAFDFPGYTVFYNGPECGASAPDHFHFQMVPRNLMPLEKDVQQTALRQIINQQDYYSISVLRNYLREVIVIQASDLQLLSRLFTSVQHVLGENIPFQQEPMMNILTWFDNCQWTLCIFPRKLRRPRQFFAEGEEKILFSPGCVDMAGVIIAPRKEDFYRYSAPLLTDLFGQVSITPDCRNTIIQQLQKIIL